MDFLAMGVLDSPGLRHALGIVRGATDAPPLEVYRDLLGLLKRWNIQFNLVSRSTRPADILADALVDAAALSRVIEPGKGLAADLGAGAGLVSAALVLLRPGVEIELVEANARKVSFLRRIAAMLAGRGWEGLRVVNARVEELREGPRWRTAFSRAVWSPAEGWERTRPYLERGGIYIALVGPGTAIPVGWSGSRYRELLPDAGDYSSRKLLWKTK